MTKKVCLVDGSGYIFRAFYGLPPMSAPDGTPVNAVYGFSNMFLKLTANIPCDYCLVLFDAKRKNFLKENRNVRFFTISLAKSGKNEYNFVMEAEFF